MQNLFQKKYLMYWLLGVVVILSLIGSLVIVLQNTNESEDSVEVTDFDSCVEVTGTVLESYPERCVFGDQTYTNPRQSLEGEGLSDTTLPKDEERKILNWMEENNLNEYGDPQGTVYTGGTPLFDETTGTYQPLYDYLISQHPDKPWLAIENTKNNQEPASIPSSDDGDAQSGGSDSAYIFSDIDDWIVYEDPKFQIDYPGEPIGVQVADANGYPVRMYTFDGFEVFLGIDENPQSDFTCSERQLIGGTLYYCHNGDPKYLSIYEYMLESIVIR